MQVDNETRGSSNRGECIRPAVKRQRTSSNDNPFSQLEDSALRHILSFIPGTYRFVASINHRFKTVYRKEYDNSMAKRGRIDGDDEVIFDGQAAERARRSITNQW